MPFFPRRLLETVGSQILLSVAFSLMFHFGIIPQIIGTVTLAMVLCLLIYFVFLFVCLKGYLLSVGNLKKYFTVNLTVVAILALLSISFAALDIEPLFTWLFFPVKVFTIKLSTIKVVSATVISFLYFAFTALMPFFVRIPPDFDK